MKGLKKTNENRSNSRGSVLVLVAVLLIVFVGVAALAIDIGYISTTKNELQNVADAAALAATSKLGEIYVNNTVYDHGTDYADIRDVVTVSLTNRAAGLDISVDDADIEVGKWDGLTHTLDTSETTFPNAVRVAARRDTVTNGQINALFAGVFGIDAFDVNVDAIAALTGQGKLEPGEVKMPIGISERWFLDTDGDGDPDGCREEIHLSDTGTACAGWHTYTSTSTDTPEIRSQAYGAILEHNQSNDNLDFLSDADKQWLLDNYSTAQDNEGRAWLLARFQDDSSKLNYFTNTSNPNSPDSYETPGADAYVTEFEFTGGVSGTLFDPEEALPALFDFFKVRDGDGDDTVWSTTIPVYKDGDTCTNPNTNTLIVGAADIVVKSINPAPANDVDIEIECSYKKLRGSGGTGGVVGIIPNLVE